MTHKKFGSPEERALVYDERTRLVKAIVEQENTVSDAKTARLRAERLAHEGDFIPSRPSKQAKATWAKLGTDLIGKI